MERKEAFVISAGVIILLTLTGSVEGTVKDECTKLPCDKTSFDAAVYEYCVVQFNQTMATTDYQLKCPWPMARQYYINLITCMEMLGNHTCCTQVSFKHKILLEIHQIYFSLCSGLKDPDPDPYVLFLLISPCIIITFITPLLFYKFRLYEKKVPKDYYRPASVLDNKSTLEKCCIQ